MSTWLSLPMEMRKALRVTFEIPRSGYVEVLDNRVLCDGTMVEDLMHLTLEKMQAFLGTKETDFNLVFNLVVAELTPKEEIITEPVTHETKKKQNKGGTRKGNVGRESDGDSEEGGGEEA